jgi:muramoyltetrapeptide carboxypeptidase LdcA involved in peptidoglycan recycling
LRFCSFKTGSSSVQDGSLKQALERLKELILEEHKGEVDEDKTQDKEENIDPRWDKLKQLLTDK